MKFDNAETLLSHLRETFTLAGLEQITGINQKQLQHYATGFRKPRPAQVKKIIDALHQKGSDLMAVEFVFD